MAANLPRNSSPVSTAGEAKTVPSLVLKPASTGILRWLPRRKWLIGRSGITSPLTLPLPLSDGKDSTAGWKGHLMGSWYREKTVLDA